MIGLKTISTLALGSALWMASATPAEAQSFDFRIGSHGHGKHKHFGLKIGFGKDRYDHGRHGRHGRRGHHGRRGYYRVVRERVWIPGRVERVWHDPVYRTRYDPCGQPRRVVVRAGYFQTIRHPGHYEYRKKRVWVPRHGRRYGGHGRRGSLGR